MNNRDDDDNDDSCNITKNMPDRFSFYLNVLKTYKISFDHIDLFCRNQAFKQLTLDRPKKR